MMKRIIALLLALILTVGLLPTVALAAEGETPTTDSGSVTKEARKDNLNLVKTVTKDGENYKVTLESWATGIVTTTTETKPLDIVLLLDVSGSMDEKYSNETIEKFVPYDYRYINFLLGYETTNSDLNDYQDTRYGVWYKIPNSETYVSVKVEKEWKLFADDDYTYSYEQNGSTIIIEKTSNGNKPPKTQFYYKESANTTKLDALKTAVSAFIDNVATNSPNSNISIVKFADDSYKNAEGNDTFWQGDYEYNYTQIVKKLTKVNTAGVTALKKAISELRAGGATASDYGLNKAQEALKDAKQERVVILFTDGEPNHQSGFDKQVATDAVNKAKELKSSNPKTTIYTVGVFKNPSTDVNTYMSSVSSNYPNASAAHKNGNWKVTDGGSDFGKYYMNATSPVDLLKAFETISSEVSGGELGAEAVLTDVIAPNFALVAPEGMTGVTAYTVDKTADGWSTQKTTLTNGVTIGADGQVSVTGFDYSENCVTTTAKPTTNDYGKKLVVEFTIHHNNYGGTQPTNAGASIKDKAGKEVIKVDDPTVPVTISKPDDVFTQANEKTYDGTGFDIFDEVAKKADDLANGTNNAFVDIEVKITVDGVEHIYTIEKGRRSGTWNQTASPKTSPNVKDENKDGMPEAYEYPVTITFKDAAEGSTASNSTTATAKFTINYAEAKVKANNKSKKATEEDPAFDATVTGMVNGEKAEEKLTYTITRTDASDNTVGDHQTITPIGDTYQNNYKVTYETGTLTITKGDPTATEFSLTGKFQKTLNSNTADVSTAGKEFELKITGATPNTNTTSLTGKVTDMTPVKVTGTEDQYTITKSFFGENDKLTFNKEGTYTYTVQEVKPAAPVAGMKYDETIYTLTIKVEDDQHGALTVSSANLTKKGESDADVVVVDFTDAVHNSYTIENTFTAAELPLDPTVDPTTGEVTPKIVKELRVTGNGETAVDMTFNVSVKDKDGKEVATGSAEIKKGAKDKATANFTDLGTLVFPEAGDYTYTIKETKGNTNGVTYDEKTYTLKVKVTAANNVLTVTDAGFSYNNGTEEVSGNFLKAPITITNIYTEPTATVPNDIKDNLEEYGYPQFPVKENDKLKLIVDKNVDKVKLAYVVAINGKAGSTVTISDPEADNTGEWSSAADGVDNRMVVFAFEDGVWTIQFKVDCTMKIFFIKTFNRNKTTGKFDTAINTVIANGSEIDSDPTTITDKDPGSFDFSDIVWKELKLTGSKSFTGAEFEATLKLTGIQHEDEVEINSLTAEYAHVEAWPLNWNYTLVAKFDENAVDGSTTLFLTSNGEHLLLDFPAAGTYTFELQETNKTSTNVTYDDTVYTVVVEVAADNQDSNKLVVTRIDALYTDEDGNVADKVIYISGETKSDVVTFVNTVDTGKDDYYPIIIPTIINKDTGMLNKTDHFAYVIGYPDGTVHPNGQITRAEVATIFFRLLRDEVRDGAFTTSNTYSDVAYGKWYNNPISTMSALGIITGYPDGTFKPNKPITRAEFAAIAARFDETQSGKSATFSDVIGHWAAKEIGIAYYNDWIKGYPDGTFKPDQNITRAEAMTLINRVLERKPESPADLLTNMNKWTDNLDTSKWYYLDVQEATNSHGYTRKTFNYELWRQMLPDPDWSRYER